MPIALQESELDRDTRQPPLLNRPIVSTADLAAQTSKQWTSLLLELTAFEFKIDSEVRSTSSFSRQDSRSYRQFGQPC